MAHFQSEFSNFRVLLIFLVRRLLLESNTSYWELSNGTKIIKSDRNESTKILFGLVQMIKSKRSAKFIFGEIQFSVSDYFNPYWQILEKSSRNSSEISISRALAGPISGKFIHHFFVSFCIQNWKPRSLQYLTSGMAILYLSLVWLLRYRRYRPSGCTT